MPISPPAARGPVNSPRRAACTIISPNYLPFARTLAASYLAQHPGQRFFVLLVAGLTDPAPFHFDPSFTPVMLPEIGVPDLRAAAMRFDILELNTNVKPSFLKHLLQTQNLDSVVYLDPDIFVYAPLTPVFDALDAGATAVLTPHMTAPVLDGRAPAEQDLLVNGTYNLGFITLSATPEAHRLLDWWETRCLQLGFSEGRTGLFVDQKWINLAPGLFDRIHISRDPGLNMAYWNLHERSLSISKPENSSFATEPNPQPTVQTPTQPPVPLRFFHFSGLPADAPHLISRNTDRFTLAGRADLQPLFAAYRAALAANSGHPAETLPYGFDRLSDGTSITRLARRLFAAHESRFANHDPFDAHGPFARFARAHRLVHGAAPAGKFTWSQFNPHDRRVTAVHRLLRLALRLLGPHRYELLMRYLGHITVLRNQSVFLRDPTWPPDSQ